jgi:hypothetical protein
MKRNLNTQQVGLFLVYIGLGVCSGAVWMNIANLQVLPSWHFEMITGHAPRPNQYRPLTPWLAEWFRPLTPRLAEWLQLPPPYGDLFLSYMLIRGLATGLALYVFDRYMRVWFAPAAAAAGALALAAIIPFTYYRVVQESDPINLLVVTAAFWALARDRDLWLIPLVLVGTLNRETTAMIPAVYLLARWRDRPAREVAWRTGILAASWAVVYFGLMRIYGWREPYTETIMWPRNVASAFPTLQVVLVYGAIWVLAALGAKRAPTIPRRALWLVPPYIGLHYVVAMVNEVRLFLPLAPILIPVSWCVLFPEARLGTEAPRKGKVA